MFVVGCITIRHLWSFVPIMGELEAEPLTEKSRNKRGTSANMQPEMSPCPRAG